MIENGQPDAGYLLQHDGKRIPFRIEYRRRKKLAITVHPQPRLEVLAPEGVSAERVLQRIEKRAAWILRQWRYFEQFLPKHPGHRYVSGETHLYLGRQYQLKVHEGTSECIKLSGRFLHVWVQARDDGARIEELLNSWYREHAEWVFRHRARLCIEQRPALKQPREPRLSIRRMSRRWGSCTKGGRILLNPNLIKVPTHCIDYVLVHELCHLRVHDHSPAFFRLMSRCMPDWEQRRERLNRYVV